MYTDFYNNITIDIFNFIYYYLYTVLIRIVIIPTSFLSYCVLHIHIKIYIFDTYLNLLNTLHVRIWIDFHERLSNCTIKYYYFKHSLNRYIIVKLSRKKIKRYFGRCLNPLNLFHYFALYPMFLGPSQIT